MTSDVLRLPAYPSANTRKDLPASQLATLNQTIASTLSVVLALPSEKRNTSSTRTFLSTYARDTAFQTLQNLIWRASSQGSRDESQKWPRSTDEKIIHKRSLLLAEKVATSAPGLDLQILLDLAITYARAQPSHLHLLFAAAAQSDAALSQAVASDLIPGLTTLLRQEATAAQGLYAQRKMAECVFAFLRGAKGVPDLIRPFARNKEFVVALATLYDVGMSAIAAAYGGIPALTAGISAQDRDADEWETIWVETKVALLDAFHFVLSSMLDDLSACPPGPQLASQTERTFDTIFALLEVPTSSSTGIPVPFLNQSLLADYQHSYSLSKLLANALKHAQEKDARLDLLESTLQSFDADTDSNNGSAHNPAGALKILLRSSGIQPGIDNLGTRNTRSSAQPTPSSTQEIPRQPIADPKGKSRAAEPIVDVDSDPDLDIKATQVLDILPDTSVRYVKLLLAHDRYGRNPEKVVEALLEGTAIGEEELEADLQRGADGADRDYDGQMAQFEETLHQPQQYSVAQRQNVFDEDELDLTRLRIGKKAAGDEVLRDRSFIEEMKADILRRAEAISDEEDEEDALGGGTSADKGKARATDTTSRRTDDVGLDEDDDDAVALRIAGDGEDSGDEDNDDEDEEGEDAVEHQTPETIIEQTYLADPKVFERDGATRRSKARADLRAQTGWQDEQIEGWKVMLDRNPAQKEKLSEKYAFRGNEKGLEVSSGGGGRGRGRGRGAPRGGRGRGGAGRGGGGGAGGESSARERAWKDKNKASRGNHNRKRGHDKKMARAGATAGPST